MNLMRKDTIIALATPQGVGAIGVIRISGPNCIALVERFFVSKNLKFKKLSDKASHTLHFGVIAHLDTVIDEVVVSLYKAPHSFTGEESVEISCHGSPFILQQVLALFLKNGCRMAEPGEFTMRAFLNGKMDLSQAEAVADLIASNSAVSHQVAMQQMRGGFSSKIKILREHLVNFASLIELELDFSEEDVEFADRSDLKKLIFQISNIILKLLESFEIGNVIKNGIPVAIVGKPNAGKSTLLNLLLDDDKAIVSEIPGTTRDVIEDEMVIDGVLFRFIDTAGIRTTTDIVEQMGVNKALEVIKKSAIVVYLFDSHELSGGDLKLEVEFMKKHINGSKLVLVANKIDVEGEEALRKEYSDFKELIYISAKEGKNIDALKHKLLELFDAKAVSATDTIVTNARHAESLRKALDALNKVTEGLNAKVPGDLLALDIRYALDELGAITGQVTNDDLLGNIFSKFCIGK
jgi:tRNA modification GTPase